MTAGRPQSPGATVLVIDDDADARDIITRTLAGVGYRVVTAENGTRGLEIAAAHTVDVIVLDVMMPGLDGLAVCSALREDERTRTVPIILLTARDDVATRAAGMRLGVSEYVTKPVNIRELLSRVQNQLHAREIRVRLDESAERLSALTGDKPTR